MIEHNDSDMKTSACMLAMNGLKPRDIAEALNVSEVQVREWLRSDYDQGGMLTLANSNRTPDAPAFRELFTGGGAIKA